MKCAIIENGTVVNIIVPPLPLGVDGINVDNRPVAIGDSYTGGEFTRDGEAVLTPTEKIVALEARIAELEAMV